MYSASIWTVAFRTSTSFKNWVLPICFPPPCPLDFKICSLYASNILRPFHILWGAAVLQNGKFRFEGPPNKDFFRLYREVLLQQSGCQKVSRKGDCFPFFRVCDVFCFSYFFLDWTWVSKLWELMASQATTVQKKFLSIKPRTQVQLVSTCLSNSPTIKSETRYPNIKGPQISKEFVKPSFWRSWFYSGPGEWS